MCSIPQTHIREIYGLSVSDTTISRVTDKILPVVREWQQRPLESDFRIPATPLFCDKSELMPIGDGFGFVRFVRW